MTRKPYRLPSGLIEGSPEANAAELAESARLDALLGLTPPTPAERRAATRRALATSRAARGQRTALGIDLTGGAR